MIVGYARTSTIEQLAGIEAQIRELTTAGCERIFREHASSVQKRVELEAVLEFVREGDILIVTKLDRLARTVAHFLQISKFLESKKVSLKILGLDFDTSSPSGKMILNTMAVIGQFEREIMLERQREGIARAKAEGKYKGRPPLAQEIVDHVLSLAPTRIKRKDVAKKLGIGEGTVYRIIREAKQKTTEVG